MPGDEGGTGGSVAAGTRPDAPAAHRSRSLRAGLSRVHRPDIGRGVPGPAVRRHCAIFLGSSGNAKTALATAITYQAIQNGFTARFTSLHMLIRTLARATKADLLEEALLEYIEPDVLCIDEIGYLTLPEQDAANVLYRVVDARHQAKKAMIMTTNKALAAWGQVLHDGDLTGAIIDRVLARGQLFELRGLSYRTRHIPPEKLGVDPALILPGRHNPTPVLLPVLHEVYRFGRARGRALL